MKTDWGCQGGMADDSVPWTNFLNWARAQTSTVYVDMQQDNYYTPSLPLTQPIYGDFTGLPARLGPFQGIADVRVWNYSSSFCAQGSYIAGHATFQNNEHDSRLVSANAGDLTVQLINASECSRFSSGDSLYFGANTLQNDSYPQNHHVNEHGKIASVASGPPCILTLQSALQNAGYLSTLPVYLPGGPSNIDQGGPFTAYLHIGSLWDCNVEIYGGLIRSFGGGQDQACVRSFKCYGVTQDGEGLIPSMNQVFLAEDCRFPNATLLEFDKGCESVTFRRCRSIGMTIQSTSINNVLLEDCILSGALNGTAKNTIIRRTSFGTWFIIGPIGYGASETLVIEGCDAPLLLTQRDVAAIGLFTREANGVLSIANADGPITNATMTLPSHQFLYNNTTNTVLGDHFTITNITQDATKTYFTTSLTGGFDPVLWADATHIRLHPMWSVTASGNLNALAPMNGLVNQPLPEALF